MRLIDADDIAPKLEGKYNQDMVRYAPTIDAVPAVRCRDCVHYEMEACLKIYEDGAVSSYAWQYREPDDFCSYGERKDGE